MSGIGNCFYRRLHCTLKNIVKKISELRIFAEKSAEMKAFLPFMILSTILAVSCQNKINKESGNELITSGTWQFVNENDTTNFLLNEGGTYQISIIKSEGNDKSVLSDSGTYRSLGFNIFELTPLEVKKDGALQTLTSSYIYRIEPTDNKTAVFSPGHLMKRIEGERDQLTNCTFESMLARGEFNYMFTRYTFKEDSLFRFVAYSQTEEIHTSDFKPDLPFQIQISDSVFSTIRTGPDKKLYIQDYSYQLYDDLLFFGKSNEPATFKKIEK